MILWLFIIGERKATGFLGEVLTEYVKRVGRYVEFKQKRFANEGDLIDFVRKAGARTRPVLLLMDSKGTQVSSEEIAEILRHYRDGGAQQLMVAIGPADGWSKEVLAKADEVISLGKITLPHELAAVVTAEQLYRALTILAGHPYHMGHLSE